MHAFGVAWSGSTSRRLVDPRLRNHVQIGDTRDDVLSAHAVQRRACWDSLARSGRPAPPGSSSTLGREVVLLVDVPAGRRSAGWAP